MTEGRPERAAYLVLGMHRSGTSALTKALAALGADLPAHPMPGDEHNEAGYFESWPISVLNDEWLRAHGSAWDDPFAYPLPEMPPERREEWLARAEAVFEEEFAGASRPLLKDPRISLLAPDWFTVLERRRVDARCVISMRSPGAVVQSLQRRDGFSPERSLLIWISYMLAAEKHSRGRARVFVAYEALVEDWRAQLGRVADAFGERRDFGGEEPVSKALAHNTGAQDLAEFGEAGALAARLVRWMDRACADEDPPPEEIDAVAQDMASVRRRLGPLVSPIAHQLDRTRAELLYHKQLVEAERERLQGEARQLAARVQELETQRERLSRRLAADETSAAPVRNSVSIVKDAPSEALLERFASREYREVWSALDPDFYAERYPDVRGFDPVAHYLEVGWREGRDPNPWFSTAAYLEARPELLQLGVNPLVDFLRSGLTDPPRPLPPPGSAPPAPDQSRPQGHSFDEVRAVIEPEFDPAFYLDVYPDVADAGIDPLTHFLDGGWREGRDPSPAFSTRHYLEAHPELAEAGVNPLYHYLTVGRSLGHRPRPQGWRYDILERLQDVDSRIAWAAQERGQVRLGDPQALRAALSGRACAHITVSQDDYTRRVGGVQLCIAREAAAMAAEGRAHIHLFPSVPGPVISDDPNYALSVLVDRAYVGEFRAREIAAAVTEGLIDKPVSVAVHNLLGHEVEALCDVLEACRPETSWFWMHDFAAVCAGYTLLRNDVEFCGAPPPGSTACMLCIYGGHRERHVAGYRRLFERLDPTLVAPSQTALDIWRRGGGPDAAEALVLPHASLTPTGDRRPREGPAVVAFLGLPVSHKGWPAFRQLAARLREDPRYAFYQLGDAPDPTAPVEFRRVAISPDHPDAMARAVRELGVDLVVIWSICPETFCLTAFEALAAGAGLIAFADSGNAAAVSAASPAGVVLSSEAELYEFFASGRAAELAGAPRALHELRLSRMSADLPRRSRAPAGGPALGRDVG